MIQMIQNQDTRQRQRYSCSNTCYKGIQGNWTYGLSHS